MRKGKVASTVHVTVTTANMEATGKSRMCCKLLFGAVCFLAVCYTAKASSVVSFHQPDSEVNSDEQAETARHARWKRSSETTSERNDNKCDAQKEKFQNAMKSIGGKPLETTVNNIFCSFKKKHFCTDLE